MVNPGDQQANVDGRTGAGGLLVPKPSSHRRGSLPHTTPCKRPFGLIEARIPACAEADAMPAAAVKRISGILRVQGIGGCWQAGLHHGSAIHGATVVVAEKLASDSGKARAV